MFSLFKITKSYKNVIKKDLTILTLTIPVVNVNIMIFVLELKLQKGRRLPVVIWI